MQTCPDFMLGKMVAKSISILRFDNKEMEYVPRPVSDLGQSHLWNVCQCLRVVICMLPARFGPRIKMRKLRAKDSCLKRFHPVIMPREHVGIFFFRSVITEKPHLLCKSRFRGQNSTRFSVRAQI